jgi:hypothetical protein
MSRAQIDEMLDRRNDKFFDSVRRDDSIKSIIVDIDAGGHKTLKDKLVEVFNNKKEEEQ